MPSNLATAVSTILLAIFAATWRLSAMITKLQTQVTDIHTNHLPHIYEELRALKKQRSPRR